MFSTHNTPGPLPPWKGDFPTLGLPDEKRGAISLWAGDKVIYGVSVSVMWNSFNGTFFVTTHAGGKRAVISDIPDLLTVAAICFDHFKNNPRKVTQGGNK